ncbi:MAG: hypothetical protein QM607_13265, partial [Microbacterium sp.]
ISRCLIVWLGFPMPQLQQEFRVRNGRVERVDFWWQLYRIIGECDGAIKYSGAFGDPSQVIMDEKQREAVLRQASDGFARWVWADFTPPERLRDILLAAGLPRLFPERRALLETLAEVFA